MHHQNMIYKKWYFLKLYHSLLFCLIFKEIKHLRITSRKFVCLGACMHAGCINYILYTQKYNSWITNDVIIWLLIIIHVLCREQKLLYNYSQKSSAKLNHKSNYDKILERKQLHSIKRDIKLFAANNNINIQLC